MRVNSVRLSGIGVFTDTLLDLSDKEGLIALVGPNGSGKTTLLEAFYATLFLEFPSRPGGIYRMCKSGSLRTDFFVGNDEYSCRVFADAAKTKTEAILVRNGTPVTSGKVTEYIAEIQRLFGSPELMLAACMSTQSRRGSFLELSPAARKDLITSVLGFAELQRLSEAAKERAKERERRGIALMSEIGYLKGYLEPCPASTIQELERNAAETESQLAELEGKAAERSRRLHVLREEAAARAAAEERLRGIETALQQELFEETAAKQRAESTMARLRERAAHLRAASDGGADPHSIAAAIDELRASLQEREKQVAVAERQLLELATVEQQIAALTQELEAAKRSAMLLDRVPCHGNGAYASCALLGDAMMAKSRVPALESRLTELRAKLTGSPSEVATWIDLERAGITQDRVKLQKLELDLKAAEQASRAALDLAAVETMLRDEQMRHEADLAARQARIVELQQAKDEAMAALAGARDHHDEIADLESQIGLIRDEIAEKKASLSRFPAWREKMERLAKAEAEHAAIETDVTGWERLAFALGRDGIQAFELDAVGPEISDIATEMLRGLFGDRFEVSIATQISTKSGTQKEAFEVLVGDHRRGIRDTAAVLSGGEKAIVSEALSLALAVVAARRAGIVYETMFRDETAGALDPERARLYVRMLRQAMDIIGCKQLVFVAQQPEVWQMADHVIRVEGGRLV
jgi:exonuclease SbcC